MSYAGVQKEFILLTEQLSRMTDELVSQRESHLALVKEVSQQNATLAALAERITAHNRLLEERKSSDHMRIGALETRLTYAEAMIENLNRAKWKMAGMFAALVIVLSNIDEILKWIT